MANSIIQHRRGIIARNGLTSYAAIHDAATGNSVSQSGASTGSIAAGQRYDAPIIGWWVQRGVVMFDTSAIPAGAVISAASIKFTSVTDNSDTDFDIVIVSGTDLVDTLVLADYGDLLDDITSLGLLTTVGIVPGEIPLNAGGIATNTQFSFAISYCGVR